MYYILAFIAGLVVGAGLALLICLWRQRAAQRQVQQGLDQMRQTFAALAGEALDANSRRLADQAAASLEGKKALIDQSVAAVNERLEHVRAVLQKIEAERKQDLGQLGSSVASLSATAGKLHEMLASSQRRGAWGERMAEDVLRLAGLQEGVNYARQSSADAAAGRPDFTFFLPNDLKANMDVKFPLDRYKAYADAATDEARAGELRQLVQAVRLHVRSTAGRGYIDPAAPTVDYVIVFIPSEHVFSLVLSAQPDLVDESLAQKVVLASPLTLYAMLSIIRQAAEHDNLLRTADEVLGLLGQFAREWGKYTEQMDRLGRRIEQMREDFDHLRTTRTNALQRPLDRIEALRQSRSLPRGE